jgi:hypothetical protein
MAKHPVPVGLQEEGLSGKDGILAAGLLVIVMYEKNAHAEISFPIRAPTLVTFA